MEILKTSLMFTAIGMGTVFLLLIFISFIISLFRFLPQPEKAQPAAAPAAPVPAVSSGEDEEELIAVITAAIIASMSTEEAPVKGDDYVVRNIRRV